MKRVHPKYKKISELKSFCPNCNERLRGDNTHLSPYKCSCGVWEHGMYTSVFGHKITKDEQKSKQEDSL